MSVGPLRSLWLLPSLVAASARAQSLAEPSQLFGGIQVRVFSFERIQTVRRLWQVAYPIGAVTASGRFRFDLGTSFVSTGLTRIDSTSSRVDHLTDTQVRGAYVFGRDAVVATLSLNLPTGPRHATARDYTVIGAVSPTFLDFPVPAYASGFSATGGLAAAIPAGNWSLGLAGSLRISSRFEPYQDAAGPFVYKSGVEGRIRGGADGLVGSSRLTFGLTYSTFGDDQFGSGGVLRGAYHPGPRWLAEAALLAPVGSSTLNLSLWSFRRLAGDTTGASTRNKENLDAAELSVAIPIGSVILQPELSGRVSRPQAGRAHLVGLGTSLQIPLGDRVTLTPTGRYDTGSVSDASDIRTGLTGAYGALILRVKP